MALGRLLTWCVEEIAVEAKAAAQWEDRALPLRDRNARARRLLAEISTQVVAAGNPRDFVRGLPGVSPGMRTEVAYLVFRMVQAHLYVAATQAHRLRDSQARECDSLLLMGLALDLPELHPVRLHGTARKVLERAFRGGRAEAERGIAQELERRVSALEGLPHARVGLGAMEFLTLALSLDLATVWFDDLRIGPEELAALRCRASERGAAVLGLLRTTARADGGISPEEDALLAAVQAAMPVLGREAPGPAAARLTVERLPEVLWSAEERCGVIACMLAVAAADGHSDPAEVRLCRAVAEALRLSDSEVDRLLPALAPEIS